MCRYCRHLQELRKEDQRTIERWKRYCAREEDLLEEVVFFIGLCDGPPAAVKYRERLVEKIKNFLRKDTIR